MTTSFGIDMGGYSGGNTVVAVGTRERNGVAHVRVFKRQTLATKLAGKDLIQNQIDAMESRTPSQGANLVARAWTDAAFHGDVLRDAKAAAEAMGIDLAGSPAMQAVQNTENVHHMVVCTLCSCYPRLLLGVPPAWYKSRSYRSRAVVDPRGVLAEFGTILPEAMDIQVVDSTADLRYVVIPARPSGTENWSAADLSRLVTRDSMIGVTPALDPSTPIANAP